MSKSSEICSPAFSQSEHPWTAQLYAVRHNHETSLKIRDTALCSEAAAVRILAEQFRSIRRLSAGTGQEHTRAVMIYHGVNQKRSGDDARVSTFSAVTTSPDLFAAGSTRS